MNDCPLPVKMLGAMLSVVESGSRPLGGASNDSFGMPSLGGENIKLDGSLDLRTVRFVPVDFFSSMRTGHLKSSDIIINTIGASTGKVGRYRGEYAEAAINGNLSLLRVTDDTDPSYLFYYMQSEKAQQDISKFIMGSAQPYLDNNFIEMYIPFPPREEQQRIAEVLDDVNEAILFTEQIIDKYKKLRKGLSTGLFNSDTMSLPSMSDVGSFRLGDFVRFTRGVSWSAEDECDLPTSSTHPVLRIPNIQSRLVLDDVLLVDFPGGVSEKYLATPGSILMVGSNGNPRRVGNAVQILPQDGEFYFASFLIALKSCDSGLDERYLFHWIRSDVIQDLISRSVQGSTGLANLSMGFLNDLPLILPSLAEQRRIAGTLDELEETIQVNLEQFEKLQQLRAGLCDDLFSGKVRTVAE